MASERRWFSVTQLFTANGTPQGKITVSDVAGFYVKSKVRVLSNTQQPILLEVKRIEGTTDLYVGDPNKDIQDRTDVSAFVLADSASITLFEQEMPKIKPDDIWQAVYAREPIVALRQLLVDKYGRPYDSSNPLPTNATFSGSLIVALDALTPPNQSDPDNVLIAGSEDGTKGGIKHAARVDSSLDLRVGISNGPNKAAVNGTGELSVIDSGTQALLNAANTLLLNIQSILGQIDNGIPASLGQKPMATSMPVVISNDQTAIPVTLADEPLKISGTENGQPAGPEFTFVNNLRLQILAAKDRVQSITYADFGTKNQRVTQIDYTAPSIGAGPGFTARKSFTYTLVGVNYRRDLITWSLV